MKKVSIIVERDRETADDDKTDMRVVYVVELAEHAECVEELAKWIEQYQEGLITERDVFTFSIDHLLRVMSERMGE